MVMRKDSRIERKAARYDYLFFLEGDEKMGKVEGKVEEFVISEEAEKFDGDSLVDDKPKANWMSDHFGVSAEFSFV